ncbi:MAG: hypothetical protein H6Q89_1144 [Myxococcaceae bacterium]|nr:hypothetical protein [Myxococcaceae bacterium]
MQSFWDSEGALQSVMRSQLGPALEKAQPRLKKLGERAANEGCAWAATADAQGPTLLTRDRNGNRIDEIVYHPAYRQLQELGYGAGIVAATYDPKLAPERGNAPKALTFGLGYLFGQAESGMYCPVCMTDGAARQLVKHGTKALQERFIPRLASMDLDRLYTGAMFLTEKEGGSDVGQCVSVAKGDGEKAKLYGEKWFCSNVDADVIMILARPEGAVAGTRGLGLYLLPRTLDDGKTRNGYRIERLKNKLGTRSMPTGEVTLEGAEAWMLGGPGHGFHQMTDMLNLSRLYNAVASVGGMRRALLEAMEWSKQRVAFGKKVIEHPLMTEMLFDMACEQRAALHWSFRGVALLDKVDGGRASEEEKRTLRILTPLLKYVLGKRAVSVCSEGVEALGGNGYIEDWPMARVFRDAQVLPIWEGTTNVLVLDAFRAVRKEAAHEVMFAEIERCTAEAPADLQARLGQLLDEVKAGLATLAGDPKAEHGLRDWTDRAALLWQVSLCCSKKLGAGSAWDLRAARRVLSRNVPTGLLRKDPASVEELEGVAHLA